MSASGITLICMASMLLSSASLLQISAGGFGIWGTADPNDPIGSENRVMLIQLSASLSCVLFVFGLITMFSS